MTLLEAGTGQQSDAISPTHRWCADCREHQAIGEISDRCPVCDPAPYKAKSDQAQRAAADAERRSIERIKYRQMATDREARLATIRLQVEFQPRS